jgi:hypothetical protein
MASAEDRGESVSDDDVSRNTSMPLSGSPGGASPACRLLGNQWRRSDGLPNYTPGTAAYKSCLLRQGVVGQDGSDGYNTMASPPPAPTLICIPLGIDSSCN